MEKMEQYEQVIKRTRESVSGTLGSLSGMDSLSQREKEIVRMIQEELARAVPIQNHLLELSRGGGREEAQEVLHTELRPWLMRWMPK